MNITEKQREKFWAKVDTSGDCWVWTRYTNQWGYGRLTLGGNKQYLAHRVAWTMEHGPIPEGMFVLHSCDNPACVRPEHLFLGTNYDNMQDMKAKGRASRKGNPGPRQRPTHCRRGHEFTEENTYVVKSTGMRSCRTCRAINQREFWSKKVNELLGKAY